MDGTIQSVVRIQDPTRTNRPTVVQVVSRSVHPKRGRDAAYAIPLTIDSCQSRPSLLERGAQGSLPSWRQVTNNTTATSKRTWETYQRDSWSIESSKALDPHLENMTF